jgi:PDZ domain
MSAPRHLWSGDWELESAAAADELARRRPQIDEDPPPAEVGPPRPSLAARTIAWLRQVRRDLGRWWGLRHGSRRRRLRPAALVAVALLLVAGAAYAVSSLAGGSAKPAAVAAGHPWLGIETTSSPFAAVGIQTIAGGPFASGAIVTNVVAGSPAAAAGLAPGDLITAINNHQVTAPAGIETALGGLHVGDQVTIQYEQGLNTYTTRATLAARPPGYP